MCGIAGKISLRGNRVQEADILTMTNALRHRGPDDSGVYLSPDGRIGLGQRRLSIVDLSSLGHQPMEYRERYQIVFNGEIYNFPTLRTQLEKEGYTFRSHTDTEVILALYDRYGPACLYHLRGMFSFALYDAQAQLIFCARDRVGKKPFKYYYNGKYFLFASELKALLTQPECPREVDQVAIYHYLTLQYVPAPLTGFKDIQKLEPAHSLTLNLKTGTLKKERYWQLDYGKKLQLREAEWKERILITLEDSVKIRMIADVPLGAFLSGGIDSSAVVAMMAKHSRQPVKTFSIGFTSQTHNELPFAKMVAERYDTEHTEFMVEPNALEVLPELVYHYEEPYADSSALPTYYVSRLAREHVTVALNGDGGDENFAGYERYSVQKLAHRLRPMKPLIAAAASLATGLNHLTPHSRWERATRFSHSLNQSPGRRFAGYTSYFTEEQKEALYTHEQYTALREEDTYSLIEALFAAAGTEDPVEQAMYADFVSYLPEDLLAKVDIASMMVALEGRSPFLDHTLLELTAALPSSYKLRGIIDKKYILKKSLEPLLPREVMYRPKRGFSIPIAEWFRENLHDYAKEHILEPEFLRRNGFRQIYVEKLLSDHRSTGLNYGNHLWSLLTLSLWYERFFPSSHLT
jgi:asparagine synthase (glutamine-hydrolysing)